MGDASEIPTAPDYGRRLINSVIDSLAFEDPHRVIYSFSLADPTDGFRDVTIRALANAINRAARWMETSLGQKSPNFETVGYIGPADLRYQILTFAAVKAGYKMLLNSPRNSIEGHMNVINASECNIWALPSKHIGNVKEILARRAMRVIFVPELDELLDEQEVPLYPYLKTFREACDEPFVVLHTSGSTGLPKPIIVKQAWPAMIDAIRLMPEVDGKKIQVLYWEGLRIYSTFPNFHSGGINLNYCLPVYYGVTNIQGPIDKPISTTLINTMIDTANAEALMLAPSSVEEMAYNTSTLERLKKVKVVITGGGPISAEAGALINSVTTIDNNIGSTEGAMFPVTRADPDTWNYFHFHPHNGFSFRSYGNESDGLFEMVQVKNSELELHQGYHITFPGYDEISTKDLYSEHPTKKGRWLYRGRADDILVLSNGEKLNPLDMEAMLNDHPAIRSALIVGQARFQTASLIELVSAQPPSNTDEKEALIISILPFLEKANKTAPKYAWLQSNYIIFATPDKPFLRAGKGSVQRRMTVDSYKDEINALYKNADTELSSARDHFDIQSIETVTEGMTKILFDVTGLHISNEEDIFAAGVDSLAVFSILRRLRMILESQNNLGVKLPSLMANDIYNNPTISSIAKLFFTLVHPELQTEDLKSNPEESNMRQMEALIAKYRAKLLPAPTTPPTFSKANDEISIILTGSTGSLGAYLLDALLSLKHITRIYCLNRSPDGETKQIKSSIARGLHSDWGTKVQFLQVDLYKSDFGIEKEKYQELLEYVTHIIHNAWPVNFNLPLSTFAPHIAGITNLINFSVQSSQTQQKPTPKITFISSIGSVTGSQSSSPIPEALTTDLSSSEMGYGSSKLVAELLLEEGRKISGIESIICRVGQIAGPVERGMKGEWNRGEWLPSIIFTSTHLRQIPTTLGSQDSITWMPVDHVAQILLELSSLPTPPTSSSSSLTPSTDLTTSITGTETTQIYHLQNPNPTTFSTLLPTILEHLQTSLPGNTSPIPVPYKTWLKTLQDSATSPQPIKTDPNPGIKLLPFFNSLDPDSLSPTITSRPILSTTKTRLKSPTLNNMPIVGPEWMSLWMEQWGFI